MTQNGEDQPFIEVLQTLRYNMWVVGCGCRMRVCECYGCVRVLWVCAWVRGCDISVKVCTILVPTRGRERERERPFKGNSRLKVNTRGGMRVMFGRTLHNGGRERQRQNESGPKMLVKGG
jgi:hypothetical protein